MLGLTAVGVCGSGSVYVSFFFFSPSFFFMNDELEVAGVCICPAGWIFIRKASSRAGEVMLEEGRVSDGEASALPCSRSEV